MDGVAAGCGGLKCFGKEYAEIKRMYVRPALRGLGLAKRMLEHLEEVALGESIRILRLETGIHQPEAIGLYERMGYRRIASFGDYTEDPLNLFLLKPWK